MHLETRSRSHRRCRVCGADAATAYGVHCPGHAARARRHGHPEQRTVTQAALKPYHEIVARYRHRNKGLMWDAIHARWDAVVTTAKGMLAEVRAGGAHVRGMRQAAVSIVTIADSVPVERVVDNVVAIFLMEEFDRRMFRDDEGFRAQLVRVLRRLTPANAGSWKNPNTGTTKRAYVELSPSARRHMAALIIPALGAVGLHIAKLERARIEVEKGAKGAFNAALDAIVS